MSCAMKSAQAGTSALPPFPGVSLRSFAFLSWWIKHWEGGDLQRVSPTELNISSLLVAAIPAAFERKRMPGEQWIKHQCLFLTPTGLELLPIYSRKWFF